MDQTSGSPWDEPIPEHKEPQKIKPTVVGNLDVNSQTQPPSAPAAKPQDSAPTSLKVPVSTDEKVGAKIDIAKSDEVTKLNTPQSAPVEQPVASKQPSPPKPSENFWQSVYASQPENSSQPSQPVESNVPATSPPQRSQTQAIAPRQQIPLSQAPKAAQPVQSAPVPAVAPTRSAPRISRSTSIIIAGVLGLLVLFSGGVFLTEYGLISVGLEKVYGALRLESLWHGLPANAENAFLLSASEVQSKQNFKVSGTATLVVNKGVKSQIISPIVTSTALPVVSLKDESVAEKISAILAVANVDGFAEDEVDNSGLTSDDQTPSDPAIPSTSGSTAPSATANPSTAPTTPTTTTPDSATTTTTSDQASTVEQLALEINSEISNDVSGADITVSRSGNKRSTISLVNSKSNLYLKTSGDVVYNTNAKNGWTKIDLKSGLSNSAKESFFSDSFSSSDFSIVGKRLGNEKIDGVRCYHYQGQIALGNSLSSFGIKGSEITSADIDYWLGVKDHLIYKIEMKIVPGSQSAVTRIDSSLNFNDYNESSGEYSVPTSSVPYTPSATAQNTDLSTEKGRDTQRKSDLAAIAQSLEKYHTAVGRYPQVTGTAKISSSSGALYNALVPTYLRSLPIDPQDPKYYYGYISDGSSFKLSAVLEDKADSQGIAAGSLWIYYLSSL